MELEALLRLKRNIRAVGFDDAPFVRYTSHPVGLAGIVCAGTRFEGMLWGQIEADGWDSTNTVIDLLKGSKFLPQLHMILFDGLCVGGFNVIDLERLSRQFQLPCVAVMRRMPNFSKIEQALSRLPHKQERLALMSKAGIVHQYPPFYFCGH